MIGNSRKDTWGVFLERICLIVAPPHMPQPVAILPKDRFSAVFAISQFHKETEFVHIVLVRVTLQLSLNLQVGSFKLCRMTGEVCGGGVLVLTQILWKGYLRLACASTESQAKERLGWPR